MAIRICIVDDHMVVQDGIAAMAEREPDLELCGRASDSREALELLPSARPDVMLVDVRIGSENGFELCERIRREHPGVRVAIFSAFGDPDLLQASVRAGAVGYVLKDVSTRRLPEIIRQLHETGSYFDPKLASPMLLGVLEGDGGSQRPLRLSGRELEILRAVAAGKTNREIARELSLSPHTIKFYMSKLMRMLGVGRRAELVRVGHDKQLL